MIFLLLHSATSFYLPGLAPVSFCEPGQTGKENEVPDCKVVRSKKKKKYKMRQRFHAIFLLIISWKVKLSYQLTCLLAANVSILKLLGRDQNSLLSWLPFEAG